VPDAIRLHSTRLAGRRPAGRNLVRAGRAGSASEHLPKEPTRDENPAPSLAFPVRCAAPVQDYGFSERRQSLSADTPTDRA